MAVSACPRIIYVRKLTSELYFVALHSGVNQSSRRDSPVADATGESRYAHPWVSCPANEGLKSAAASVAKKPVLNPQRISDGAF